MDRSTSLLDQMMIVVDDASDDASGGRYGKTTGREEETLVRRWCVSSRNRLERDHRYIRNELFR